MPLILKLILKSSKKNLTLKDIRDHSEIVDLFELILSNTNAPVDNGVSICNLLAHTVVLKISTNW